MNSNDIDLWEINEAFSVVSMAAIEDFSIDKDKVNIYGRFWCIGINKPELKKRNKRKRELATILIDCFLQVKPIKKPMFDTKIIMGIIYIIIKNISDANRFALLNERVISNEKINWIKPIIEDQSIAAIICSLLDSGAHSIVFE